MRLRGMPKLEPNERMTLRKNDLRRRIDPATARAIVYTLQRLSEKCPADLFGTLLVEAGEAWAGERAGQVPRFYWDPTQCRVRYRTR
jgi:hypothetical protein